MDQKYVIHLLGFDVLLMDRRDGTVKDDFIIVTSPEEYPEDLEDANRAIRGHYAALGYHVKDIRYRESKVKTLDLEKEYEAAPTLKEYNEQKGV